MLAVHEPTGERLDATTDRTGRFQLLNVRVGGPYTVTATLGGFADHVDRNVFVALGEDRALRVQMTIAALSTTVDVTQRAAPGDHTLEATLGCGGEAPAGRLGRRHQRGTASKVHDSPPHSGQALGWRSPRTVVPR